MTPIAPTKNYVFQPGTASPKELDPEIYGVTGPDAQGFRGWRGTKSEAEKRAAELNKLFNRV